MMPTKSKPRLWIKLMLCCLWITVALFFFIKGEDSPYDFFTMAGEVQVFRERGISAYTYCFVWSKSRRDYVSKIEDGSLSEILIRRGYSADSLPSTLSALMVRNIGIATILSIVAAALGINVLLQFRSKGVRS